MIEALIDIKEADLGFCVEMTVGGDGGRGREDIYVNRALGNLNCPSEF